MMIGRSDKSSYSQVLPVRSLGAVGAFLAFLPSPGTFWEANLDLVGPLITDSASNLISVGG
jgi:hypothetical protein